MGSTLLGAFVGFIVIIALAFLFPGIGHIVGGFIGGFVAGLIARGMLKGALAGFLSAVAGGIILAVLAFLGAIFEGGNFGFLGALLG